MCLKTFSFSIRYNANLRGFNRKADRIYIPWLHQLIIYKIQQYFKQNKCKLLFHYRTNSFMLISKASRLAVLYFYHPLCLKVHVVCTSGLKGGSLVSPNLPFLIYDSAIFRQRYRQAIKSRFSIRT